MGWFIPAAIGALAGGAATAYSSSQAGKAIKGQRDIYGNLEYEQDPIFEETQKFLSEFGMDILKGDANDYYSPIGEFGGEEFENMLSLTNRDIEKSTTNALARTGRARGGQLAASVAPAIADSSIKARYADFERAMKGREFLMGKGLSTTEGARSSAFANQVNENNFNIGKAGVMADLLSQDADRKSRAFSSYMGLADNFMTSADEGGAIARLGKIFTKLR